MSKVEITLRSGGSFVFSLYHSEYCEKIGACECTINKLMRPTVAKDGSVGQQYFKAVNPRSVYLTEGVSVVLDAAVLNFSQIVSARKQGLLEVKVIEPEAVSQPDTQPNSPAEER